jgi:hypothetical protein
MMTEAKYFLAGVTLAGWRQADGTLLSPSGEMFMQDFPETVELKGCVFTLESVSQAGLYGRRLALPGDPRGVFENAEYV